MHAAESSSSQSALSMTGSGALSHVYIEYPPFRCNIPGALGVMYDDGSRLLIVPSPNKVFSWPVGRHSHSDSPSITAVDNGQVLGARFSLDGKVLAIQRSDHEIVYFNREHGLKFSQPCKSRTERLLGFFWTDCPACDIVYVTTSGLELYSLSPGMDGLKLVDVKLSNVSWFIYTHESRLVLLASGMQCKTFLGYQFSAGGIIRLPKFDVSMTKAEANKKPVLAPEDVRIATMYGRLYCLQVDRVAMELNIYRFYRDAVVPQGTLPIYSEKVAISVVDGVLLVHQISSKVVLLYDILSDMKTPISAPLPLLLRGFSGLPGSIQSNQSPPNYTSGSAISDDVEPLSSSERTIYGDGWAFLNPDIILDHTNGLLWRIHLDLEAIAASSSDIPSLLAFLQRRRLDVEKAKELSITVLRSTIVEKRSLSLIAEAMNVITLAYSQSLKSSSSSLRKQATSKSPKPVSTEEQSLSESVPGCSSSPLVSDTESVSSEVLGRSYGPDHKQGADGIGRKGHESSLVEVLNGANNASQEVQDDANSVDAKSDDFRNISRQTESPMQNMADQKNSTISDLQEGSGKLSLNNEPQSSGSQSQKLSAEQTSQKSTMHSGKPTEHAAQTSGVAVAAISPEEVHCFVFSLLKEEMAVDSTFLLSAIIEYMRSAATGKLKVPPGLQALVIQLLAKDSRHAEIWHFIYNKIIEPSREVAVQLLEAGKDHPPTSKLGMDMLKQLAFHADYISLLLQNGRLLEALRYARQNRVEAVPPSTFLESAAVTKDAEKLACVLRFCLDFVPNFEQTPEYSSKIAVLRQHNATVVG